MSLGMRWMAWIADYDETALWNFGNFGRFVRMRRKKNKSDSLGFSGYGFLKEKTFGMYPLPPPPRTLCQNPEKNGSFPIPITCWKSGVRGGDAIRSLQ